MIIIKNIILYFIQIRHTDDFPSTGTRLVMLIVAIRIRIIIAIIIIITLISLDPLSSLSLMWLNCCPLGS